MSNEQDENWKRRRQRELEAEEEEKEKENAKQGIAPALAGASELDRLTQAASSLMEQTNRMYKMFFEGREKFPPSERRNRLETIMRKIDREPKPTPQARFKAQSVQHKFLLYRERWDRRMKDLERTS
jgi:hypothetical protein